MATKAPSKPRGKTAGLTAWERASLAEDRYAEVLRAATDVVATEPDDVVQAARQAAAKLLQREFEMAVMPALK